MFVVLEGLDGVGKTSAIRALSERLAYENVKCTTTHEPFYNTSAKSASDFIADRASHVQSVIGPTLSTSNSILLCDRYILSTVAYQSNSDADAQRLLACQTHFPQPHITFLLDAPIATLQQRIAARGKCKSFDAATVEKKNDIRARYLTLALHQPNVIIINSNRPIDDVVSDMLAHILKIKSIVLTKNQKK
jgi:dTMP kinase